MAARRALIIDLVRTPFGKGRKSGALANWHPVNLLATTISELVRRTGIDPALIEDVITGCVLQVGEQSGNIGRQAALAAGLPEHVPAVTIDRKCGSAQQAMDFAAQGVIAGAYDVVVAAGVEMMSLIPMRSNRLGKDNYGRLLRLRYPKGHVHQGISAELIAAHYQIFREQQDAFALRSHQLSARAQDLGLLNSDLLPVGKSGMQNDHEIIGSDEGVRRDTSLEKLASLRPAFVDEALTERFPEIQWSVTAGNSSQVSDGAGAVLIVEEAVAGKLGLKPRAAIEGFAVVGDDPIVMLTGVIPATRRLLQKTGYNIADIDCFEVNEAFASVVLAWEKTLGADPARVNPLGGAIASGHPVGASGIRLLANLLKGLEHYQGNLGLQTMCESGGMANATLIRRL